MHRKTNAEQSHSDSWRWLALLHLTHFVTSLVSTKMNIGGVDAKTILIKMLTVSVFPFCGFANMTSWATNFYCFLSVNLLLHKIYLSGPQQVHQGFIRPSTPKKFADPCCNVTMLFWTFIIEMGYVTWETVPMYFRKLVSVILWRSFSVVQHCTTFCRSVFPVRGLSPDSRANMYGFDGEIPTRLLVSLRRSTAWWASGGKRT